MAAAHRDEHDGRNGYCRQLGHHLSFAYCRSGADATPCARILDCWHEQFNVHSFVSRYYPDLLLPADQQPPATKLLNLVDLIEKARHRCACASAPDG